MRTRLALVVLLTAACGSGAAPDQLAGPTATPTPTVTPSQPAAPTPAATILATAGTGTSSPYRQQSPPASAPPATLRPTAGTTVVRDDDSSSTLHVRVGQLIRVRLEQGTWDPPESSSAAVERRSSSGGYPTDHPVDALFEAVSPGTAELSASSDAACFHTEPRCMMPTRLWQVHVVVT
jgi:hypothetical protein